MAVIAIALSALMSASVSAQDSPRYPNRPIKLIVPFAPGGGLDYLGRLVAENLSVRLGQSVVVENKLGAGGTVGADMVAKAAPDGHTLLIVSASFSVASAVSKTPYDPVADFAHVIRVVDAPLIMVTSPAVPATNLKEFVAYGKSNPSKLFYGSSGLGGISHLAGEDFKKSAGIAMSHVPYKGIGPANTAVVSNEVQLSFTDTGAVSPLITAGRVKALAVGGSGRLKALPNVPTVAEAGFPDLRLNIYYGLLAPRNTPQEIVNFLNREINAMLKTPSVADTLASRFATPIGGSPDDLRTVVKSEYDHWKKFIETTGIKVTE